MANPSQLYLLADHIKLSLLERQRALSLNLESNNLDGTISRSLESMREGIEAVEQEIARLEAKDSPSPDLLDQATRLHTQYDDLTRQFHGFSTASTVQPNTAALRPDFAAATTLPAAAGQTPKSVRFTDRPPSPPDPARAALFPYRDDPDDRSGLPDQSHLSNQGIHAYHATVLAEQDEQLDRLGESIGRQRDLSIQIGDELDEHVAMLDEVDGHVERHAGRLEVARKGIGRIVKRANDNRQLTVIAILIVLLVLLIVIFK